MVKSWQEITCPLTKPRLPSLFLCVVENGHKVEADSATPESIDDEINCTLYKYCT